MKDGKICIYAIGVFPPPVSGQTIAFKSFLKRLDKSDRVEKVLTLNVSGGRVRNTTFKVIKFLRGICLTPLFLAGGISARKKVLYFSPDSGFGRFLDMYIYLLASLFGFKKIIHHHSYGMLARFSHLDRFYWYLLKNDLHIFLSDVMRKDYFAKYPEVSCYVVNNVHAVVAAERAKVFGDSGITLGMISNLTKEKGVYQFLDIFEKGNSDFDFILAGPAVSKEVESEINIRVCEGLSYLGPVYEEEKNDFYNRIDIFLFPTRYKNEAQPLVILEALSRGIPVVASDVGAIKDIITDSDFLMSPEDGTNEWLAKIKTLALLSEDERKERALAQYYSLLNSCDSTIEKILDGFF